MRIGIIIKTSSYQGYFGNNWFVMSSTKSHHKTRGEYVTKLHNESQGS